jgi:ElaB/YqjD/DUF883 family membrane-anchored ribosome-binding protein
MTRRRRVDAKTSYRAEMSWKAPLSGSAEAKLVRAWSQVGRAFFLLILKPWRSKAVTTKAALVVIAGLYLLCATGCGDDESVARREARTQRHRAEKLERELSAARERRGRAEDRLSAAQAQANSATGNARRQTEQAEAAEDRARSAQSNYTVAASAAVALSVGFLLLTLTILRQVRTRRCLARLLRWKTQQQRGGDSPRS